MLAGINQQGMIFIIHPRVLRQRGLDIIPNLMIIGVKADPAVAGENAMGIGVDHKGWQSAGVE